MGYLLISGRRRTRYN